MVLGSLVTHVGEEHVLVGKLFHNRLSEFNSDFIIIDRRIL